MSLEERLAAYAQRTPEQVRADAALHECGHALGHVTVGVPFSRIVLAAGDGSDQWPKLAGQVEGELRCDFRRAAVILWAGPHAEGHYLGGYTDLKKINALGPELDPRDRGPRSPWMTAKRLVHANRALLRTLAGELVQRGELSYDEFKSLCTRR